MLKFDTRDKKPKLYHVAVASVLVVAVLVLLFNAGPQKYALQFSILLGLYYLFVLGSLLTAWVRQIHYNPYSYNTIYYMGFAVFMLSVIVTHIYISSYVLRDPVNYDTRSILSAMEGSARNYIYLSIPFLTAFSAALCISNISLIRHEGKRFVNILGIILSGLLLAGVALIFWFDYYATGSYLEVLLHTIVANLMAAFYLYFECMLIGTIVADLVVVRYEPEPDKDFIIILGCGFRKDGTLPPLLRGRVDRAIAFYRKQKELTGKELRFVTSGGQGPNEVTTESFAMKRYLLEQGFREDQIIEEDRSRNTFENMKFSKLKIAEQNPLAKIAFSTTNYHVFRSGLYARRNKMRAVGMGARTKWYFWPNAAVREFVGLLTEHRLKQALVLGGMAVFYIVITILAL